MGGRPRGRVSSSFDSERLNDNAAGCVPVSDAPSHTHPPTHPLTSRRWLQLPSTHTAHLSLLQPALPLHPGQPLPLRVPPSNPSNASIHQPFRAPTPPPFIPALHAPFVAVHASAAQAGAGAGASPQHRPRHLAAFAPAEVPPAAAPKSGGRPLAALSHTHRPFTSAPAPHPCTARPVCTASCCPVHKTLPNGPMPDDLTVHAVTALCWADLKAPPPACSRHSCRAASVSAITDDPFSVDGALHVVSRYAVGHTRGPLRRGVSRAAGQPIWHVRSSWTRGQQAGKPAHSTWGTGHEDGATCSRPA